MAARSIKNQRINLLPQEEFAQSTFGRILKWLLTSFRLIVIATEMIVMGAFLSRFWLDAKISDLTDSINQKKAIISSYADVEKEMRQTQKQLSIFSSLAYDQSKYIPLLEILTPILPPDLQITSIVIDKANLQLKATTLSEGSASSFISSLKNTALFDKIAITQVLTDQTTNLMTFQIEATFKGQAPKGESNGT